MEYNFVSWTGGFLFGVVHQKRLSFFAGPTFSAISSAGLQKCLRWAWVKALHLIHLAVGAGIWALSHPLDTPKKKSPGPIKCEHFSLCQNYNETINKGGF
jgi:hypothetical protein